MNCYVTCLFLAAIVAGIRSGLCCICRTVRFDKLRPEIDTHCYFDQTTLGQQTPGQVSNYVGIRNGVQTLRTQDTSDLGHFSMSEVSRHFGTILTGLDSLVVTVYGKVTACGALSIAHVWSI